MKLDSFGYLCNAIVRPVLGYLLFSLYFCPRESPYLFFELKCLCARVSAFVSVFVCLRARHRIVFFCICMFVFVFLCWWWFFLVGVPARRVNPEEVTPIVESGHARKRNRQTQTGKRTITQKRNLADFSFPSGVGPANPCTQVGRVHHVSLDKTEFAVIPICTYGQPEALQVESSANVAIRVVRASQTFALILQSHECDMVFGAACIYPCHGLVEKVS